MTPHSDPKSHFRRERLQLHFGYMAKRRVAEIMGQRCSLSDIGINIGWRERPVGGIFAPRSREHFSQPPSHLSHLQRVRQAVMIDVAFRC